jgi:hypothetical protein
LIDDIDELETDFRSKQNSGAIESDADLVARLQQWYDAYT